MNTDPSVPRSRHPILETLISTSKFSLLLPLLKVVCLIRVFVRHPLLSIGGIPFNFYKNTFVIDVFQSPQVIPGSDEVLPFRGLDAYDVILSTADDIRHDFEMYIDWERMPSLILEILGAVILISLAISFRIAIKSTAVVWLPLLFIIRQSRPGIKVLDRMELTVKQPWFKLMLCYSLLVIGGLLLKIGLVYGVWKFADLYWLGPLGVLVTRFVEPYDVPLWQVTIAVNGGLAWAFFFRASRHVLARNSSEAWPDTWVAREYVAFQGMRTTLSLYGIACTFYIAIITAYQAEWPRIHFILFPWTASFGQ